MKNKESGVPTKDALTIAIVRGLAFAVVTVIYLLLNQWFDGYLWAVYIGFFLTMALGTEKEKFLTYICSLLAGYIWAIPYLYGETILTSLFSISSGVAMVIAEFLITGCLLFVHLKFFAGTLLGTVPAVFAAIASVFASKGGIESIPFCTVSVIIGICMAVGTTIIIDFIKKLRVR